MIIVPGLLLVGITHAATVSTPQLALVTVGPGRTYWERFGHDAIVVNEPSARQPIIYNYERSVTVQMLNLTPAQARQLAAFLAWNARPQNARYRYDHFINNCATKV